MTTRTWVATVFTLLGFGCTSAIAQLPIAPEPHPTLDELVKEFKRYGLPIPPKNAELVRITMGFSEYLGFRCPPLKPGDDPRFLAGSDYLEFRSFDSSTGVKPTLVALEGLTLRWSSDLLCLAVQCRMRGWDELADALYAQARNEINAAPIIIEEPQPLFPNGAHYRRLYVPGLRGRIDERSVSNELRHAAWFYWQPQIMWWGSDRKEILKYLKLLDPNNPTNRDLALTIAPRKSKPGSVEALIDELTEYRGETFWNRDRHRSEEAYRKLVELGFDAVPALIEHLDDQRFTRHLGEDGVIQPELLSSSMVRVGHVAAWILDDLSLGEIADGHRWPQSVSADKVNAWWARARKAGEERSLLDHALFRPGQLFDTKAQALRDAILFESNEVILRVLGTKYPSRLRPIYETILTKCPESESQLVAKAIVASKLPRAEKVELLEQGASNKLFVHRLAALDGLAEVDIVAFRKILIATLQWLPKGIEDWSYSQPPESQLSWLVLLSDDPKCWDALAETTKRVAIGLRFQLIWGIWINEGTFKPDAEMRVRREQIRYLQRFLDDASIRGSPPEKMLGVDVEEAKTSQIRDVAAQYLAWEFGIKIERNLKRGSIERFAIRGIVAQLAERELARPMK
jgi:hypothetical protein